MATGCGKGQLRKVVIVNADDFGLCAGVNRGIIHAHQHGVVTSASLMVLGQAACEAAALARENPRLSVGLHLDIGEWTRRDGRWAMVYSHADWNDARSIERETARQLALFRALVGRNPTHIDSHQHFHRRPPGYDIVARMARELGVPLRAVTPDIHYCGLFFGAMYDGAPCPERIRPEALIGILDHLPSGVTELACHPGLGDEPLEGYDLGRRAIETRTLCSESVRSAVSRRGIERWSFADYLACDAPPAPEAAELDAFREWATRAALEQMASRLPAGLTGP